MESLDILSYGVSMTTLEEVFLRANGDIEDKDKPKADIVPGSDAFFAQKTDEKARGSSVNNHRRSNESNGIEEEKGQLVREDPETGSQNDEDDAALSSENLVGSGSLG